MDDCDGYVRGWGTYRKWTHQKGVTDVCEGWGIRHPAALGLWAFHYLKVLRRHTKVMKCTSHKDKCGYGNGRIIRVRRMCAKDGAHIIAGTPSRYEILNHSYGGLC